MTPMPGWLPELVLFNDYGGDWNTYQEELYKYFHEQFIASTPSFQGTKLSLKRHPVIHGKESTFWHMISDGPVEEDRLPDLRRCERIRWPRPTIENDASADIKFWKNKRSGENRYLIWIQDQEYLVVLSERKGYLLFWTAYLVTREHQKKKLMKEFESYRVSPW